MLAPNASSTMVNHLTARKKMLESQQVLVGLRVSPRRGEVLGDLCAKFAPIHARRRSCPEPGAAKNLLVSAPGIMARTARVRS